MSRSERLARIREYEEYDRVNVRDSAVKVDIKVNRIKLLEEISKTQKIQCIKFNKNFWSLENSVRWMLDHELLYCEVDSNSYKWYKFTVVSPSELKDIKSVKISKHIRVAFGTGL